MTRRGRRLWLASALFGALAGSCAAPAGAGTVVSLWHMDELLGSTMNDSVGSNNGSLKNVALGVPGFLNTAFGFNGSSSVATVPSSSSLNPGPSDFSFTVHVRFSTVPSSSVGDYDLLRKGLSSTSGGDYKIEILRSGVTSCFFRGSSGSATLTAGPNLANDAWHTLTCSKQSGAITLTVDAQTFTKSATIGSISNSAVLSIGAKTGGGDWYLGTMDEVSFALGSAGGPPTQVTTSAASGLTSTSATLNGSANPNGSSAHGYFRYSTTSPGTCNNTFGTATPTVSLGSGTSAVSFSTGLAGLSPSTTYYYCAIADNSNGTTASSNLLSFTTSAGGGTSAATADFDAGTNGATIATSDPGSATKWNTVTLSSSTIVYDNAHAHGKLAAEFATSSAGGAPYLGWTSVGLGGTPSNWYGRVYLYLPANLPLTTRIVLIRSGGVSVASLRLRTDGRIDLVDSSATVRATSAKALALNAWNRLEWHIVNNATAGSLECKLFLGGNADGASADDTFSFANFGTGSNTDAVRFGLNTSGANLGPIWFDDIVAGAGAYPGPAF